MSLLRDFFAWLQQMTQQEPVLTLAVIQTGIAMLVGFGLGWTGEQVALTTAFLAAVLGYIARQRVTPV